MRPPVSHRRGRPPIHTRHSLGQRGAALILAIVFLGAILGVTTILFLYSQTTAAGIQAYRTNRDLHYAADSALEEGINMVGTAGNYQLGTDLRYDSTARLPYTSPSCALQVPLQLFQPSAGAGPQYLYGTTSSSYLVVTCTPTPVTSSSVPGSVPCSVGSSSYCYPSGGLDADGGQSVRDVTFKVTCFTQNGNNNQPVNGANQFDCGASGTQVGSNVNGYTLASARVQFIPDYSTYGPVCHDPAGNPPSCSAPYGGTTQRAMIPKVITFSVNRN